MVGQFQMIYLHKVLPVFFLPTGIAILLILMGLLLHRRVLCGWGLFVLLFCSMPLVSNFIMKMVEGGQERLSVQNIQQAYAIVVLSGGLKKPPGKLAANEWSASAINRFEAGVELFKAGKGSLLVFTGGWAPWQPSAVPEGQILANRALKEGIGLSNVFVTDKVTNTAEEALAVGRHLKRTVLKASDRRIILVTSAFHMRRAQMLFERAGLVVVAFPVDFWSSTDNTFTILDIMPSAHSLYKSEVALREFYGFLYYMFISGV
jgi:uncharacterized SAM-binding protein YcdF (DUF218 family)